MLFSWLFPINQKQQKLVMIGKGSSPYLKVIFFFSVLNFPHQAVPISCGFSTSRTSFTPSSDDSTSANRYLTWHLCIYLSVLCSYIKIYTYIYKSPCGVVWYEIVQKCKYIVGLWLLHILFRFLAAHTFVLCLSLGKPFLWQEHLLQHSTMFYQAQYNGITQNAVHADVFDIRWNL